jgi:transposase-like protein
MSASGSGDAGGSGGERVVPYHCPYCASENLRPSEDGHGVWECHSCARAFSVKFVGLVSRAR